MDFTPLARHIFIKKAERTESWSTRSGEIQLAVLRNLLHRGGRNKYLPTADWQSYGADAGLYEAFRSTVPIIEYEDIREYVLRMINGETDVLWPGRCMNYAQSSGTSGGRSKYIPITPDSLKNCHYKGAADCVAHYLSTNPKSRLFSGKAFVLGGSFAHQLEVSNPKVRIGDLSATLIQDINPLANLFRVPDKKTALIPDWQDKLPALVNAASNQNITNISGVPSWFLTVIKEVMRVKGVDKISDVWPNLEVFFHGGISFDPYRDIYESITDSGKMHFMETYNASEGFFAVQNDSADRSMLLIIDNDVFYEFKELGTDKEPVMITDVEPGKIYELIITSSNGLWRYRLGDTIRIASTNPVKIKIAGRTKTFINAFGEELMEENAEAAMSEACRRTHSHMANYTAAPVFATDKKKGRHQWIIEWTKAPKDIEAFANILDDELRKVNSDYDAKRSHTIFLDPPEIISAPAGTFDKWLSSVGSGKLGGQRKIPRLSNDRKINDAIISILRS